MKVKQAITKKVKDALNGCKETLSWAIIELCKQVDTERTGEVRLPHPFTLTISKTGKKDGALFVECNLINCIKYGPEDRMGNLFILYYNDVGIASSFLLPVGDLQIVYDELKKIVSQK